MFRHVVLEGANEALFDGRTPTAELRYWLDHNVGRRAYDRTELIWATSPRWYLLVTNAPENPYYSAARIFSRREPCFGHFFFNKESLATLFKLTWGGVC